MLSFQQLIERRGWRWRPALAAKPTTRNFTLRELLALLERCRDNAPVASPYLDRLAALVKEDFAASEQFPERRGGPDTGRSLGAWRARYNGLDRYLAPWLARKPLGQAPGPDETDGRALSDAENEGWPLPAGGPQGHAGQVFRAGNASMGHRR